MSAPSDAPYDPSPLITSIASTNCRVTRHLMSINHYNQKVSEAENKAATKQAEADQKREEEIRKANKQNKF
jgi:hypothetical protein